MNKLLLLASALFLASVSALHAHADTIDAYVLKFETQPSGEYLIVLRSEPRDGLQGQIDPEQAKPRTYNIFLNFNPRKTGGDSTDARIDEWEAEFTKAADILKRAQVEKTKITIGRMSGKGFNPIRNRPGFYRSEMIMVVDWFREPTVCFFHSSHYYYAPK